LFRPATSGWRAPVPRLQPAPRPRAGAGGPRPGSEPGQVRERRRAGRYRGWRARLALGDPGAGGGGPRRHPGHGLEGVAGPIRRPVLDRRLLEPPDGAALVLTLQALVLTVRR